ncbi:MAG: tetratricopeptide repeat protein [Myxococcales bacterium]|nr:tetratricopeptide repeat protein [Myxococcales bacterium]
MSTAAELLAAFEANPSDHRAFEALIKHLVSEDDRETLELVFTQAPTWAGGDPQHAVLRILSQQARLTKEEPLSSFLNYQNGLLLWQQFNDPQKAEMSFRKVEVPPEDPSLLRKFYLDFYIEQNNWRRLEQFLSEPAKGGMEDQVEVKRLLGRLANDHGQPDKAIGFWQGVRQAVPEDDEAEANLRRLYVDVGKWLSMIDLLKENYDRLPGGDVGGRTAILLEQIDIYKNHLNTASKVVATWQQVLDIDPANTAALDALAAEYAEMNRWPDLVKVLQQKVAHETDPERLIALHREIASIMMDRFSNTTEAIKSYEAILELDPESKDAIRVLKDIYEQRRDWDNYILIAERELGLLPEGREKHEQFVALARLASERIRRPQTPIALWERVLNFDDAHVEALEQLEQLYEREKNFKSLASILEKRAELDPDVGNQVALLEKLGMVVSVRLNDQERGAEVWKLILERDPEHRKAQAELKKKYVTEHDWESLEWFFRTYGNVTEWVRTLESQAKSSEEEAERTELLFKAAAVWKDELDDQRRAVKNLENVLELAPDHAGAARLLIPIYHDLENYRALPPVYDIVLEATDDPATRRELLLAQADVQEKHLGAPDAAFFAYVQAVSEAPNAVELHGQLRRLAEASNNWESYAYVLQEIVEQVKDEHDRIGVLLEIGRVFREHMGSPEDALAFFNRVLALDPYNRDALGHAETAYAAAKAYDKLVLVCEKKLVVANDSAERKAILFRLARVWKEDIGANDEAEAILREMLDDFPDETDVHDELIGILLEDRRFAPLREILELKRDVLTSRGASDATLADIECELGMLAFGTRSTGAGVDAVVDHYEAALGHDPAHATSVLRLEELLADESQRGRITHILEPIYQQRAEWAKLSQILEIQYRQAVAEEDQLTQVELLDRLSLLYQQQLGDADLAWRAYARRFQLEPQNAGVRHELQRLTPGLSRFQALVDLYTAHADEPLDKGSRLAIKLEIARGWQLHLSSLEDARIFYHKVLDEEPEHKEALDALESIYVDLDRAEDLLGIYRRKIELTDDTDQKLDYLFRTSDLLRDRLDRPDDAIIAAREALDIAPGHLPAVQRLDELYTITERWDDLARTLEDTIDLVRDDQERVVVLKIRLAGVFEQYLDDPQRAVEIYAEVLAAEPDNAAAIEALERLFENDALAPTIAPVLQPVYDRRGDWQKLIDVYCVREAASDDVAEKVDWNYKIAELYELIGGMPENAFGHYEAAAALDPGNERTLAELLRLAGELDNHGELIHFLQGVVEEIPDDGRRVETHRTIAGLARTKTKDLEGAEKQLRAILDVDPGDMAAVDDLIAIYREQGEPQKLVEMLLHKAGLEHDLGVRQALYTEAGGISADLLEDHAQAVEIYETLHGLDPNETGALNALERLYERTADWDNLVRIYREKIDRSDATADKKDYAARMGRVQADKLESPHDAIETWHRILAWDAEDQNALDQLDALYTQEEDWFNLQSILRKKQELADADAWEAAQFRIARLYESDEQLGDVLQAIACYGDLLDRNPQHEGAVNALKTILAERDAYEGAFEVLAPVLRRNAAYEELWQQYEVLAGHEAHDPLKKVATLHAMAELAELELEDPRRALGAQSRAFALDPRNDRTMAELNRIAEENGFWEELVGIFQNTVSDTEDPDLQLSLRLRIGAILMDRVNDPERAIEAYKAVYDEAPDHREAQSRLHRLYESAGLWKSLAEVLRVEADTAPSNDERIGFLKRLGAVSEQQLGDTNAAFESYTEILDLERNSPLAVAELRRLFDAGVKRLDIADRLEPIYREQEAWGELESVMQQKLDALDDPIDQMQLMRDLAQLNLENQGRPEAALRWFGRAFVLDPEDDGLLAQLRTLAEETGRFGDFKQILMDAADAADEDDRRVSLWHAAAEVSNEQLQNPEEAERIYRLILEVDEANLRALQALDRLLTDAERWQDLEPVLVRETASDDVFDDERIRLWVRLAELYRDRLGDREKSVAAWREVLELNDIHEEALKALQAIYTEDERWPELFEVLQRLLDCARSERDRVLYASDMAAIAETALDNPARAIELWEDVLAIAPNDVEAVHELQRLLAAQENWQGLAEAYDRELRMGVADTARQLELHREMGRLWQERLDDPFQAQMCWQRAREVDPHDRAALDALRALHAEGGNDDALSEVIEASLASSHYGPDEQLALWRQQAVLRTEVFVDHKKAIDAWVAVLGLAPGDAAAIDALERLYEVEGRWDDLVALYREKLRHIAADDERFATWVALGSIQHDNLGDVEAASQTYRDILAERPGHLEASRRLEAIYERTEQWEPLGQLLLDRNDHLDDKEDRLQNLQRLASIYEQRLAQPDMAFLVLQRANQEVPDEEQVLLELERLAREAGLWQELSEVYEATLPHLDGDAALDVLLKSANLQRDRLENASAAIGLYERARELSSDSEKALRALVELNEQEGRWQQLVAALDGLSEVTPDYNEKITLLKRMAIVEEEHLHATDRAVEAWLRVLDVDEMDREALGALERLHIERRDWNALIEIYERMATLEPDRESELKLKIAGILEAHLKKVDDAIETYEEVLAFDAGNRVALERLEGLYGEREDWAKLVDVYDRAFTAAHNDEERVEMARKIALLQDAVFDDPEAAARSYHDILTISPEDQEAFDALQRIYTNRESWADLIDLYERRYDAATSSDARADALSALARIYRDRLGDVDNAIAAYQRVLLERRTDRPALDALEAMYRELELWEQVLEVLDHKLSVESEPAERVQLLCAQGDLAARELNDSFRAAESYQRVLKEEPGYPHAVNALVRIYKADDRYEKVVEILKHRLAVAPDNREKSEIHVELALAYANKLSQPDTALENLETAAQLDPESRRALWELAEFYIHAEQWTKAMPLLDLLVDKLDADQDKEQLFRVRKNLGLCAEQVYQYEQAIDELEQAAALMPPDRATLEALARLHYRKENYDVAERYLQEVIDKYRTVLSDDEQTQIYMQLGESALKIGNIDKAQQHLRELVQRQPDNTTALRQIIEVLKAYGDWPNAVPYMQQLLSLETDPLKRHQLLLELGDAYAQKLSNPTQAKETYRAAFDLGVFPKEPALKLVELSGQSRDFLEAIRYLNHLIQIEEEPKRKAQYAFTAAMLYRDELGDPAQAIKYYNLTLDHNIENLRAFQTIDELLTKSHQWKPLEQNYRRMIQRVQQAAGSWDQAPALLFTLFKNLGEIYRSRLMNLESAVSAFELAKKQRPNDEAVREILAGLYEVMPNGPPKAVDHHRFLIQQNPKRIDSYHKLFELFKKTGQHDSAWCTAGLLVALNQGNEGERHYYDTYLSQTMSEPNRVIDQTLWMHGIMSRGEDAELGAIFELVYHGLGKYLPAKNVKDFGLKKKSRIEPDEGLLVTSVAKNVARMFGLTTPELYRGTEATGIEILPTSPPVIMLGTDMLTGRSDRELAFFLAKRMAYFHPWHVITTIYGRDALEHLYMGACSLVDPGYQMVLREDVPKDEQQRIATTVGEIRASLDKSMPPELRQQLAAVMQSLWRRTRTPEIGKWHRQIELTANHAGLVAAGDVGLVGQLVRNEAQGMSKLKSSEKLTDFVQYVTSEPYLALRRQLGVQIDYSELIG